jgi:hypothetical protein
MATLTERYVAAVARGVPEDQRPDVERDTAAAIADLTEARVAAGEGPDAAERAALLELGDPVRLAAEYSSRPLQLIGPAIYPDYVRLLGVLLAVVLPLTAVGVTLGNLLAHGDPGRTAANAVTTTLSVFVQLCFWVTAVFAVLERTGNGKPLTRWQPEQLHDVPAHGQPRLGDTVASVVLSLAVVGYILWQQFRSPFAIGGVPVPLFDPALWNFWLPYFIVVLLAGVALEIFRFRTGGWRWPLFAVNVVLDLAFALPALWLLSAGALLNPEFTGRLPWWDIARPSIGATIVVVIVGVTLWDVVDTFIKTRRDGDFRRRGAIGAGRD